MFEVLLMGMDIILYPVNHENTMFKQVAYRIVLPIVHVTYVIQSTFVKLLCVFVCVRARACVCVSICSTFYWIGTSGTSHFRYKIRHKHMKYVHTVKICYWHNTLGPDTCKCNSNFLISIKRSTCYIQAGNTTGIWYFFSRLSVSGSFNLWFCYITLSITGLPHLAAT